MEKFVSTATCNAIHKQSDIQFSETKADIKDIKEILTNHMVHMSKDITQLKDKVEAIEKRLDKGSANFQWSVGVGVTILTVAINVIIRLVLKI